MKKPRRTRFSVTNCQRNGRPIDDMHLMAFSLQGARDLMEQHNLTGDLQTYAQQVARDARRHGSYRLDQPKVLEAIEYLGLKLPVQIHYSTKAGNTRGNYRLGKTMRGPNFHNIMLKSYIGAEQASRTLWHELCHAMQAEREILDAGLSLIDPDSKRTWHAADARGKGMRYKSKPIEVEAREHELLAEDHALAVRT